MLLALLLAAGSALFGGALALVARDRPTPLELTRTFAFAAAATVVGLHLLPEVLRELGPTGLLWAAVGFLLPGLLEWAARAAGPRLRGRGLSSARVAAETGFVALFLHSLLEGLALDAAARAPGGHADLMIALVAHHGPLTAAVALPLLELIGPRATWVRVLLVAAAGALGTVVGALAPPLAGQGALSVVGGVMAGALLHVVSDEIRPQRWSQPWERLADLVACAAGVMVVALGASVSRSAGREALVLLDAARQGTGLLLLAAPALLLGDLLAVALRRSRRAGLSRLADLPGASPAALLVLLPIFGPAPGGVRLVLGLVLGLAPGLFARTPAQAPAPEEPPLFSAVLLAQAAVQWPRRLSALLLGGASLAVLGPGAPLWAQLLVLGGAGLLSGAAGALLLVPLLAAGAPLLPALLALALPPALLRLRLHPLSPGRRALQLGALAGAAAHAALLLRSGALLGPAADLARETALQVALPLGDQLSRSPVRTLCLLLLSRPALETLWTTGVRAWLLPLRHPGGAADGHAGE